MFKKCCDEATEKLMTDFFAHALALKRDVLISSEELDTLPSGPLHRLKTMLTGFNVTVVYVYREFMSHFISLHFERSRYHMYEPRYSQSFSSYLLESMDELPAIVNDMHTMSTVAEVFGRQHIAIIDLLGAQAAEAPIEGVFMCEIAGVMCGKKEQFGKQHPMNVHSDLVPVQVFSVFQAYYEMQNGGKCQMCEKGSNKLYLFILHHFKKLARDPRSRTYYEYFYQALVGYRDGNRGVMGKVPPRIASRLQPLLPFAEELDEAFRARFGDRIWHGNRGANLGAMHGDVYVEELDVQAFTVDPFWAQWIVDQFELSVREKLLCDCV
jgi:hypothetical protein